MIKIEQLGLFSSVNYPKIIFLHFIGVFIFIAFETSLALVLNPDIGFWENVVYYLLEIATFYVNLFCVMPLANHRGREVRFLLGLVLLIVSFCICRIALLKVLYPVMFAQIVNEGHMDKMFARAGWRGIYIIGLSIVYWLFKRDKKAALERKQLEIDKLKAIAEKRRIEVSLLQMQLEPHLITNVLAFVYEKIEVIAPDAALAVDRLSELMKHSLTDVISLNKVPIEEEIEGVKTLIAIQGSLANKPLSIELDIEQNEGHGDELIPPNLLTTFIDNIFTHGIVDNPATPARVKISVDNSMFYFRCENAKSNMDFRGKGLGMSNVRSILNYFYQEQYELSVAESETYYSLDLKIAL
ncbi:histidine kinase [Sphingobacterium detergens]|uniref:Histidine kinase n=1 Tax=Sphingobacterium detergens TaxID=1145106 RepID=A0A420B6W2_SPHD1|nr:histidine kinase [Sphingobacterium detergens]RKE52399.1 histidine kinase [Sphingobacterium detergens]